LPYSRTFYHNCRIEFSFETACNAQYHKEGKPEFYSDIKPLTVTGHHLKVTAEDVTSVPTTALLKLLRSHYPEESDSVGPEDIPRTSESFTDGQVLELILKSKIKGIHSGIGGSPFSVS
jgi:hypothetical protein